MYFYNYHDTLLIVFVYIIRSIPDWGCRMRFFPEEIVLEITGKCMVYDQQMKDKKFVSFVIDLSHSRKNNSLFVHATKILLVPHYLTLSSLNLPLSSHPLQAANCCRNSRLVVDEDDLKSVKN